MLQSVTWLMSYATRSGPDGCCSSQLFQCFSLFWSLLSTKLKFLRKYFVQPDKLDVQSVTWLMRCATRSGPDAFFYFGVYYLPSNIWRNISYSTTILFLELVTWVMRCATRSGPGVYFLFTNLNLRKYFL